MTSAIASVTFADLLPPALVTMTTTQQLSELSQRQAKLMEEEAASKKVEAQLWANQRPCFTWEEMQPVAATFGNFSFVKNLPSERDQNFLLRVEGSEDMVVLKINSPSDDLPFIECQNIGLQRASDAGGKCQRIMQTHDGKAIVSLAMANGAVCQVRMLTFLPGKMLADAAGSCAPEDQAQLWSQVGKAVGGVSASLLDMQHAATDVQDFDWDLQRCEEVISKLLVYIPEKQRPLIDRFLEEYRRDVKPLLPHLRKSVVHNDPNDYNLVVTKDGGVGVIDFGDMMRSYTCSDAAICMAYLLFNVPKGEPLVQSMVPFVSAFHEKCPLSHFELQALFGLAVMRVCTSVCMSAYQISKEPWNEYLLISAGPAWNLLERLAVESRHTAKPRKVPAPLVTRTGKPVSDYEYSESMITAFDEGDSLLRCE